MKNTFLMFSALMFSSLCFGQNSLKQALDDFHWTLAFTYHPMIDDTNFAPIRNRSFELVQKADSLEKYLDQLEQKSQGIESLVDQLKEQCKALHEVIQQGALNEIIRVRLSKIHDLFHDIEYKYEVSGNETK